MFSIGQSVTIKDEVFGTLTGRRGVIRESLKTILGTNYLVRVTFRRGYHQDFWLSDYELKG